MSLIIINPEVKNLDNFFQSKYNSFEELRRDLISAASIFKLKRRNHFLFKYFNKQQSHFEKRFERMFFHQLISFKNIDKLTIKDKQFIELFYFKYFAFQNFRKTIKKDQRIIPIAFLLSTLIDSEIIFYDFFYGLSDSNYQHFVFHLNMSILDYNINKYDFTNKNLLINFIDTLKQKLEPNLFERLIESENFKQIFIAYEACLLKEKIENF